jgi:Trypsin-like serine proteases, typically periplasmic, contain C-terminal PDZ domain
LPGGADTPPALSSSQDSGLDRLGLAVETVDAALKDKWRLPGGVRVTRVDPQGAAADAGVAPGDVIAQLGFEQINTFEDYTRITAKLPSDSLLPIRFFRDGRPTFRTIRLQ